MSLIITLSVILSSVIFHSEAAEGPFSYQKQNLWGGVCVHGNKGEQSPINIDTNLVKKNSSLTAIQFSNTWNTQSSGTIKNVGSTVQFSPKRPGEVYFNSFLGTYDLLQFHFHWGPDTGYGSEHLINGRRSELEIHFVHTLRDARSNSQRNYLAVLGVLVDVEEGDGNLTGVWSQLDIPAVESNTSGAVNITRLILSRLLPADRSYYYYIGSLTTPPCSEIVQWFVFKDKLRVPLAFLSQLRMIEEPDGQELDTNYRAVQLLGSRFVMEGVTGGTPTLYKPAMIVALVSLLLSKLI